jgi:hypothetical protein
MRQFFSWRIWAAFGALIGLTLLLKASLPASSSPNTPAAHSAVRTVDFISLVFQVAPSENFAIVDGVTQGSAAFILDGHRTMQITPGTLGQNDCAGYTEIAHCVVFADLLGDAVVWFAIVPAEPGLKVSLPPIVSLLGNGVVQLSNGWLVRTAKSVDYKCPQETGSLSEFLSKFGPDSTTVIDVSKQRVTAVQCSQFIKSGG